jgi:hypothetical protein
VSTVDEAAAAAMFEHSPLPMWTYDRETLRFVAVNEAAVRHYGYSREQFATMTIADIRPREDHAALHEDVAHAQGFSDTARWRHIKADGSTILVEIKANDLVIGGRAVRLVLIKDVTERVRAEEALRKAEDQLRHAQKMDAIGRLAGGVAHDFNNVLTVIQSYACMLEENGELPPASQQDAAEIRRAAQRAAGMTRQLLTLSRDGIASPRPVRLDDLIAGFMPMLRRMLGESVRLEIHSGHVPEVIIDPGQMEQILMNLAINARDAMPGGGRLAFETRVVDDDGPTVELAVSDTGVGMDRETQLKIFEPFFTTKDPGKGTGLGLSIVHGIVTQARGKISVYSEVGHGTTFRVRIPIARDSQVIVEQPLPPAPRTLPSLRVLVIDDQPDVRSVAARILQDAGCKVIEAATANEARKICVSHDDPIDLVLLDVVLGDTRGELLMPELHELRRGMAFILMTGYSASALTRSTNANVLAKPFTPAELRAMVARVCGTERSAEVSASEAIGKRRALVADDDESVRKVVARLLRRSDFDVVDVDSGFKAITALEAEQFDVVVSDVEMPDGGGLDLLRSVRRIDLDVPVILMTGQPSIGAAAEAVQYGAFRYLTKPVEAATFVNTVKQAARAHALARIRREAVRVTGVSPVATDRAGLEVRFEQALDSLRMVYQPIVYASSGALFGLEALMRSSEPSLPSPPAVLDAATTLGRLSAVGRKIRGLASAAFAERTDDVALFVNLHPEDLFDIDLVDDDAPLTKLAKRVVLEVTERSSLDASEQLTERLARVRQLGFRIAVDDIGAGYSGLTSFTELTPEVVKIDMSLVRDVHQSALKQRTIGALCRLCHEVGTLVVGEGVETLEEREALVGLGCDLLQGYLIGKPR